MMGEVTAVLGAMQAYVQGSVQPAGPEDSERIVALEDQLEDVRRGQVGAADTAGKLDAAERESCCYAAGGEHWAMCVCVCVCACVCVWCVCV